MKQRILGLDTGTNSLGWAVVDRFDDGHYELVKKGVLIFQEGVKIEKGIESSKAAERTSHRALRKQYFRRRLRKIEVLKVLSKHNFCPALTDEDLKLWHNKKIYPAKEEFMLWQRTNDNEDKNPYHCRYICLNTVLDFNKQEDRYTFGRAMYHLAQRRGFLSNRLDASEDNTENSKVKKSIAELSNKIEDAGCKYLGEYFYKLYSEQGNLAKIRTQYTDREHHYLAEFNAICQKQGLAQELKEELTRALYFQRPLKSQRQSVGKCTFEKGKSRVSTSHYLYEEFRLLSFLNSVRIQTPYDDEMRPLNEKELAKIDKLFYRKSKANFDFEEIAKAIAGKDKYMTRGEKIEKPYVFNYRMTQGVSGCPTIAQLRSIFGEDWKNGIAETYKLTTRKDSTPKSVEEMANDIWNVLFFFDSNEKLKEFALNNLQLDEKQAEDFSKIRLNRDYASLSLKAIRNIIPFLRMGMPYSHAVFMGNIPQLVGKNVWNDENQREYIITEIHRMANSPQEEDKSQRLTLEFCIKDFLQTKYNIREKELDALYHPSMIETYPDPKPNKDGVILLGSPRTNAVRNPMAMRSLHQLRKVVNNLILEGIIDHSTIVHIEYARELNNANQRAAINQWQRDLEKKHKKYADEIQKELRKEATPTDILKFQLWEEQDHICLYTGEQIGIEDFLGSSPAYDIEHTIPQSVGGDSTQENMTLCNSAYNRNIKKAKIPSQLAEYEAILERIQHWKDKADELSKQIDKLSHGRGSDKASNDKRIQKKNRLKLERDYWRGKYQRFIMTEVPEGFARRQGAGIGLVSKYAGLYLKSYFKDIEHPERRQIYSIKGTTTSDFRKMWGIQDVYDKKSRDSHTHHCIDAIVIACIGKREYDACAAYYHQLEERKYGIADKPQFPKPWASFTEDIKSITEELLVVHNTPDNMPKKASKKVEIKGKGKKVAKGDCARSSLHNDTYYGAIERNGEVRYVVRRDITSFEKISEIENIVDDTVREIVRNAVKDKDFKTAIAQPIYMNKEKGILIKKVRCYVPTVKSPLNIRKHRDPSTKEYKQQFHVANDSNYCMAIYEGEIKGKKKRAFKIVNMLDAATHFKHSNCSNEHNLLEDSISLPWKQTIKIGTNVLLFEKSADELYALDAKSLSPRLYKVIGLSSMLVSGCRYGVIQLRHSTESRAAKEVKSKNGAYIQGETLRPAITMLHTQFNALVEGQDFDITPLGEIKFKE